eukprot:IDg11076t1
MSLHESEHHCTDFPQKQQNEDTLQHYTVSLLHSWSNTTSLDENENIKLSNRCFELIGQFKHVARDCHTFFSQTYKKICLLPVARQTSPHSVQDSEVQAE